MAGDEWSQYAVKAPVKEIPKDEWSQYAVPSDKGSEQPKTSHEAPIDRELNKGFATDATTFKNAPDVKSTTPRLDKAADIAKGVQDILFSPSKAMVNGIKDLPRLSVDLAKMAGTPFSQDDAGTKATIILKTLEHTAKTGFQLMNAAPPVAAFTMGAEAAGKAVPEKYMNYVLAPVKTILNDGLSSMPAPVADFLKNNEAAQAGVGLLDVVAQGLVIHGLGEVGKTVQGKLDGIDKVADKMRDGEDLHVDEVNKAAQAVRDNPVIMQKAATQAVVDNTHPDAQHLKDKEIKLHQDVRALSETMGADQAHAILAPEIQKTTEELQQQQANIAERDGIDKSLENPDLHESTKAILEKRKSELQDSIDKLNPKKDATTETKPDQAVDAAGVHNEGGDSSASDAGKAKETVKVGDQTEQLPAEQVEEPVKSETDGKVQEEGNEAEGQKEDALTSESSFDKAETKPVSEVTPKEEAQQIASDHGYEHPTKMLNSIEKNTGERFLTVQDATNSENPKVKDFLEGKKEQPPHTEEEITKAYKERENQLEKLKGTPEYKSQIIHDNFGGVPEKSWNEFGDRNWNTPNFKNKFFNKDAPDLDQQAQEMSDAAGVEITPQDIVDYMMDRDNNAGKYRVGGKSISELNKIAKTKPADADELIRTFGEQGIDVSTPEAVERLRGFPISDEDANLLIDYYEAKNANAKPSESVPTDTKRVGEGAKVEGEPAAEEKVDEPKITGVSRESQAARAEELGVEPAPRGTGVTPEESVLKGQEAIRNGADAEKIAEEYKQTRKVSIEDFNVLASHADELAKATNEAADKFGADSKEYKDALAKELKWNEEIINPIANEFFHQTGMRLQGDVEIDTGTYEGLQRAFKREHKKEFTPDQAKEAKELASQVKSLNEKVGDLQKKLAERIEAAIKEDSKSPKNIKEKSKNLANLIRKGKLSRPDVFSAASPASIVWDGAIEAAAKAVEAGGTIAQAIADGLDHIQKSEWYQNLENPKKGEADKAFSDHIKEQEKGGDIHTKFVDKKDSKFPPDEVKEIWTYAKKEYLDKERSFADMIHGVATDLGLSPTQVRDAISQPKGARVITDEMYRAQNRRNNAARAAKDWVKSANTPKVIKFLKALPNAFFGLATFGHGTVGMITHSGMNIFKPTSWGTYFPHFFKQFEYAFGKTAAYEKAMEDLQRDPDYVSWKRAGLAVDPTKAYDDYQVFGKNISALKNSKVGRAFIHLQQAGDRGFNALKVYRLATAKEIYSHLSEAEKADPATQKNIAQIVNHSTGTLLVPVPEGVAVALFAPRLEASRWLRLVAQPAQAIKTLMTWDKATPAEKAQAKVVGRRTGEMMATYAALLAANQGLLSATGSKQKINFTDPTKSDWLKFKAGDKTIDLSGGMVSTIRFIFNLFEASVGDQKELRGKSRFDTMKSNVGDYVIGKLSPFASTSIDFATQSDFLGNPLPFSSDKPKKGKHTLTWGEYVTQHQVPIPASEAVRDVAQSMNEKGMTSSDVNDILNGIFIGVISGGTGARVGVSPPTEASQQGAGKPKTRVQKIRESTPKTREAKIK